MLAIIGARPQFIKHAAVEIAAFGFLDVVTVHTGQHYDHKMSQVFFDQLHLKKPKYNLDVGSAMHGEQTGRMMMQLEPIVIEEKPDFVLVYGDTNSTLAGALIASKLRIEVIHIEAGLRSFNRSMPEEINRILTDHVSSILFAPTKTAVDNLKMEGITNGVFLTGDVMYDMIEIAKESGALNEISNERPYCFATIHRPYNTDSVVRMSLLLCALDKLPYKVKFSVHPRTLKGISEQVAGKVYNNIEFVEPLSYFDSIRSIFNAQLIITDSGGLQKEAYMLKKKCITIRSETEWIETLRGGWNTLVFDDMGKIGDILTQPVGEYQEGLYGDGQSAREIIRILINW